MRRITRLQHAEMLAEWPENIPRPRPRGVKALGSRYEAAVSRQLGPEAKRGQWWRFADANGPGLCQTDFCIFGDIWLVILECKHTWTEEGMDQLRELYLPVVEMATSKRMIGIQVCKHLVPGHTGPVYDSLEAAVNAARTGQYGNVSRFHPTRLVTLHWRGVGPMLSGSRTLVKEFA